MASKVIIALCASILVQTISGQCIGNPLNAGVVEVANIGLANNGLAAGYGAGYGLVGNGLAAAELAGLAYGGLGNAAIASNGGPFSVTSFSPIAPTGLSVTSENVIEGPLIVSGELPFLATVALEGQVNSAGAGGVSYGCGNGNIGIVSEGLAGAERAAGLGYGAGLAGAGLGYGAGLAGAGLAGGLGYGPGLGYGAGPAGGLVGRGAALY